MTEKDMIERMPGIEAISRRFNIRLILQFGSTVTGTTHDHSYLDLAIQLNSFPHSMPVILEIQEAFQEQFSGNTVDLTMLNRADPLLPQKIAESFRVLFGSPQDVAHFRLRAFKAYQDFRPYLELERRYVALRLAALTAGPSPS